MGLSTSSPEKPKAPAKLRSVAAAASGRVGL
jgi:hypothetical protein